MTLAYEYRDQIDVLVSNPANVLTPMLDDDPDKIAAIFPKTFVRFTPSPQP